VQPVFNTARLRLTPATESDLEELWTLWTEPQVREFLWDDVTIQRDDASKMIRDCEALAARGLGLWRILQREAFGAPVLPFLPSRVADNGLQATADCATMIRRG
jgi:RimJ/RimL family protein N-acetyltransferase